MTIETRKDELYVNEGTRTEIQEAIYGSGSILPQNHDSRENIVGMGNYYNGYQTYQKN